VRVAAAELQQQRHQRRAERLAEGVERGHQAHRRGRRTRADPPHLLQGEQGDGGERKAEQETADREAGFARPGDAEADAGGLQRVGAGEQLAPVYARADPRREQRAADDAGAEDRPEQVDQRRAGHRGAGDHRQEGGGDDVAEAGDAVAKASTPTSVRP
jgi:hypothetical protein